MCTVSFIARKNGYALAMNRDEKLTRVPGLPPKLCEAGGRAVLCPSEPGGGTWIALNDAGATLALINWYSVRARVKAGAVSRGEVVKSVRAAGSSDFVVSALAKLPLAKINPFRLIGVFPATVGIFEWRWDLKKLVCKKHAWKPRQWISSGFDEPRAQRIRRATFRRAQAQRPADGLGWLRRLHRSHAPGSGAFSTCMHRPDAATVSCTEIALSFRHATMRYHPGAPCRASKHFVRHLRLKGSMSGSGTMNRSTRD
ncbi:MAG: NRDE family protein [Verrucomicrobiia bacterium]